MAISNVVTVDAAEYLELRAMLTALTSAILPEAIEKRDVARDALTRAERALSASIGAMSDALGDVRAALELLNSEASMAPVEETATA